MSKPTHVRNRGPRKNNHPARAPARCANAEEEVRLLDCIPLPTHSFYAPSWGANTTQQAESRSGARSKRLFVGLERERERESSGSKKQPNTSCGAEKVYRTVHEACQSVPLRQTCVAACSEPSPCLLCRLANPEVIFVEKQLMNKQVIKYKNLYFEKQL